MQLYNVTTLVHYVSGPLGLCYLRGANGPQLHYISHQIVHVPQLDIPLLYFSSIGLRLF